VEPPTNYRFVIECGSHQDEQQVGRALHEALRGFSGVPDSPIPWLKIIPPSKQ
jgi:hypothetical protein